MSSRTVNTPSQGAGDGIIAFLQVHDGDLPSASELVEGCRHGRIRVITPGGLDAAAARENVVAVVCPITEVTDTLPAEVERLRSQTGILPVISLTAGGVETDLSALSRRLGCNTHFQGPVSDSILAETVRRERLLADALESIRRTREEARREHEKLTHLIEIIKTANSVLEPSRVMEVVMDRARTSVRCDLWCLFLLDEREDKLVFERAGHAARMPGHRYTVPLDHGVEGAVLRRHRPIILNEFRSHALHDAEFDRCIGVESRSVMAVPLVSRGRVIGVVKLVNRQPGDSFSPADQSLVTLLMEPAAIALENAILFKKMEHLSVTDDLTGLHNVRYLNGFLYRELKRCRRYNLPVSVVFLDMDGFKTVNDRFGHLAGSQTLTEVGQVLQRMVREIDMVARYGGDEFVVILPQTGPRGAAVIAERIRQGIAEATFLGDMGRAVNLTASLGVASFPEQGSTRDELIHQADAAMYRVKESGKNGVLSAS
ncbi:MAG: sensor domain-containing diguanylate cyclase [Acidobacteria bacterium]|nr:sensor domain-containing diguanylate cyclase [Acidobacteriota bacterium]